MALLCIKAAKIQFHHSKNDFFLTGYGVFAKVDIPALSFLFEYEGELLKRAEGEERLCQAGPGFIFFFGKSKWYALFSKHKNQYYYYFFIIVITFFLTWLI